jgi:glycyl-tRNA synthetase beta chain
VGRARALYAEAGITAAAAGDDVELRAFLAERLAHVFESRGTDRRTIRAVVPGPDVAMERPVADLQENVAALPEFAKSEQFRQLATAFKRVRNIAREYPAATFEADEAAGEPLAAILIEPAEQALLVEIDARRVAIDRAVTSGRGFRDAYLEAAKFEPVVARFFDDVFVMSDDLRLRQGRLRLMKRLEAVILQLGDISEIVASE